MHDSSGIALLCRPPEWIIMAASTIEPNAVHGCPFAGSRSAERRLRPRQVAAPSDTRTLTVARDLPTDALGLARVVTRRVRESGKHVLSASLREAMMRLRERGERDQFVAAFLDCLLDKHDGRFHNRTYLALALVELILDDPRSGLDTERLSALLMADVIRHESAVAATPPRRDDDRPDARTLGARLAHARRFVAECGVPEGAPLPVPPDGVVGEWFAMTAQPVSVVHDEYFFLRALQCHEMVFTGLAENVSGATGALREGRMRTAREQMEAAVAAFEKAALLFRVVATMRTEAFHTFREFTQGASAIQSEAYKRFEIACGRPVTERLRSDAFGNVPAVRAEALAGADDLSSAYLAARPNGRTGGPEWARFDAALVELERRHQRWKTTHHRLAARMLGDAAGSWVHSGCALPAAMRGEPPFLAATPRRVASSRRRAGTSEVLRRGDTVAVCVPQGPSWAVRCSSCSRRERWWG
jgi:tryptophan 2,3-dioxygenase